MKPLCTLLLLLLIPSYCVYAQQEGTDTLEVHSVVPPAVRQESPLGRVILSATNLIYAANALRARRALAVILGCKYVQIHQPHQSF
jgi:hypothetical protein